ncbi:hypothetical protein [Companilactobacillus jidongensis]|uniref:hypothetical protein n=1 Tax=Companilactobacillus jidongensis TaxID=2486006 RepID=UPI000F79D230|nr:hypothetical protein [Companilactobacillus jidongensis]
MKQPAVKILLGRRTSGLTKWTGLKICEAKLQVEVPDRTLAGTDPTAGEITDKRRRHTKKASCRSMMLE